MRKERNTGLILLWVIVAILGVLNIARAVTERDTVTAWVICQPGDYVNARARPTTKSESIGRLETGDAVELDGETKDGFAHSDPIHMENGDGWIHAGYLVFDEPEWKAGALYRVDANGRVACRKYIDGPRRCWVVDGSHVQVFWLTAEWAVTNKGFIRTEYLVQMEVDE